jgi:chromosome segregation ATPase
MAELTLEEQAHLKDLNALHEKLRAASASVSTTSAAREALQPEIAQVEDAIDEVAAWAMHERTIDLQAAANGISPAVQRLKDLEVRLKKIEAGIAAFSEIAKGVEQAIVSCKAISA